MHPVSYPPPGDTNVNNTDKISRIINKLKLNALNLRECMATTHAAVISRRRALPGSPEGSYPDNPRQGAVCREWQVLFKDCNAVLGYLGSSEHGNITLEEYQAKYTTDVINVNLFQAFEAAAGAF